MLKPFYVGVLLIVVTSSLLGCGKPSTTFEPLHGQSVSRQQTDKAQCDKKATLSSQRAIQNLRAYGGYIGRSVLMRKAQEDNAGNSAYLASITACMGQQGYELASGKNYKTKKRKKLRGVEGNWLEDGGTELICFYKKNWVLIDRAENIAIQGSYQLTDDILKMYTIGSQVPTLTQFNRTKRTLLINLNHDSVLYRLTSKQCPCAQQTSMSPTSLSTTHTTTFSDQSKYKHDSPDLGMDGYNPNVYKNRYGQPVILKPDHGYVPGERLKIEEDAYGLGVHKDQYGRPVREYPYP